MDLKEIIVTGYSVLIVAIVLNLLTSFFGMITWYLFVEQIGSEGLRNAFINNSIVSIGFLFFVYPLLLGLTAKTVIKKFG